MLRISEHGRGFSMTKEFRNRIGCSVNWRECDNCNVTGPINTCRVEHMLTGQLTEHNQLGSPMPKTCFVKNAKVLHQSCG